MITFVLGVHVQEAVGVSAVLRVVQRGVKIDKVLQGYLTDKKTQPPRTLP